MSALPSLFQFRRVRLRMSALPSLFQFRRIRNWIGRLKGYSACYRCGDTWNWKAYHVTQYRQTESSSSGCFPLCEACWEALTITERMPFYVRLLQRWVAGAPEDLRDEYLTVTWDQVTSAVRSGG